MDNTVDLTLEFEELRAAIQHLVEKSQGESGALLNLLRVLEQSHREVCDGPFQAALPTNRQALYNLLKNIESNGGWPYIYRMQLNAFLTNLQEMPEILEDIG